MLSFRHQAPASAKRMQACDGLRASTAVLHLLMSGALVAAILVAATAVSMGVADAQGLNTITHPDTGLVLGLMLCAVGVMGALSAVAVRFAGRSRDR
jgi:hypothetical protein